MISADHPRFSYISDMSLTIYGKIFSGPLVHTNDPSGTGVLNLICQSILISPFAMYIESDGPFKLIIHSV